MKKVFAITDIETTGGSIKQSKITEIAIILFDGEKVIDEFQSLVNPEKEIPQFITRLTGISNQMVENAPKFYEIAKVIIEFYEETIFVAHNVGFDYNIIRQEYKSLGFDFRMPHMCTVKSARKILPGHKSYSLGKISEDLNIEIEGRHRAGGDAWATVALFKKMFTKNPQAIENFIQREINPKNLHPGLDLATIEQLPKETGVYFFRNSKNEIIYIGKSKNVKTRVLQHLKNSKSQKSIKMKEEIAEVDFELTGSELIALLIESNSIKNYKPIYNRQLRSNRFPYGLYHYTDGLGYINFFIDQVKKHQTQPITTFEKKEEGNKYIDFQTEQLSLCAKYTGRYPTKHACFGYHTKQCKGACIEKESAEEYNQRAKKLIEKLSFSKASFFIIERGVKQGEIGLVLIENGIYKGYGFMETMHQQKSISAWKAKIIPQTENKDDRKIIQSYLRNSDNPQLRYFTNNE